MARRYRYEYLMRKRAKERARKEREERIQNLSSSERKVRELIGWGLYIAVLVCAIHLVTTYVGQRTVVAGDSMLNTIHDKDNLIIDKVSYRFRDPERYEIIVFPYRYAEETFYIKRIIGLPGETVQIKDGYVYINGQGNYTGTVEAKFTINKADQTFTVDQSSFEYDGTAHSIYATATSGLTVTYSNNNTITNVGTVTVTLTVAGTTNYNSATEEVTLAVTPRNISNVTIALKVQQTFTYTGLAHTRNYCY